jgi:hypothetical protein
MEHRNHTLRVIWVAIRIAAALVMMGRGGYFMYQGF